MDSQLEQEKTILERCLAEAKRKLDYFRYIQDDIQASLTEADINGMLDALQVIYKGRVPRR